jgi:predicted YcjX-like family ATPase
MTDEHANFERLARIETKMENVLERIDDLVSRAEFYPVKLLVYGLSGGILTAFLSALIFRVLGDA